MEKQNWKDLWRANYEGKGDTEGLNESVKKLSYGSRSDASYLPWAVVERIFKLQDGEIEIVRNEENTYVEKNVDKGKFWVDPDDGSIREDINYCFFINVKAIWQGKEYTERYPLQDSNGRPISAWTQNEINKATQRAKVKAIAVVSGIGYKLYEDGDLEFGNETDDTSKVNIALPTPTKTPSTPTKKKVETQVVNVGETIAPEKVKEVQVVAKPVTLEIKPVTLETKPVTLELKPETVEKQDIENNTAVAQKSKNTPRTDLEDELKVFYLQKGVEVQKKIRQFLANASVSIITDLPEDALRELYNSIA